jgi:hypothetical protein
MEFRNIEEAKAYIEGRVPGATSEQIQAAKDYLDSTEAKAEQAAKASPVLSKTQPEENESMNRLQSMSANNPAVKAAQSAGKKAVKANEEAKNAEKPKSFKENVKTFEDNVNAAIEDKDNYAKGDKLAEQSKKQVKAVQGQAEKPAEAFMESQKENENLEVGEQVGNVVSEVVSKNPTDENVEAGKNVIETVSEAEDIAVPRAYDTKEEKTAKKAYNKATASIWDAYYNGDIDKSTAVYFTIDAVAKLAGNLGKRIGNVGAQFTGGTIDNNFETSDWENRRDQLLGEANQMQAEELGGPAARKAESERLANEGAALGNVSQEIQNQVASIRANYTDEQIRQQIAMMDKQLEQMGLNIENMEDARTFVETLKQKPESERSWLDNLMIAWMSQSGVNAAVNAGSSGIGSLIGLLAK